MTLEQYYKAIGISDRIKELNEVKKEIKDKSAHRLSYSYNSNNNYILCPEWAMRSISGILDRHDRMIREEIDAEIEKLNKMIEEL